MEFHFNVTIIRLHCFFQNEGQPSGFSAMVKNYDGKYSVNATLDATKSWILEVYDTPA